jgi:hypothetical protein
MTEEKNETPAVDVEIDKKVKEIILGVTPVEFLRIHESEALAEKAVVVGKTADITPAEVAAIMAKGGDLEEDLQRLINQRQLQTELGGIGFNKREMELIGKAFNGTLVFIKHVVLPLLENRDEYNWVWHSPGNGDAGPWQFLNRKEGNQEPDDAEPHGLAREILSNLVAEVQLKDPDNKITPLVIETLARVLPEEACEEFSNTLKDLLAA